MKKIQLLLLLFSTHLMFAQVKVKDTVIRKATIGFSKKGNQVLFHSEVPPLIQIAGAPKANYSYFWEFGDGHYSKEPAPKHTYKKKKEYKVNLSVTNNYDNGKPPKTRPKMVSVIDIEDQNFTEIASLQDTIQLHIFNNREPIPEEEIVTVISYKNPLNYVTSGKIYLFYNDKEFKNDNFELIEARTHFDEKEAFENGVAYVKETNGAFDDIASAESVWKTNKITEEDQNLELTLAQAKNEFKNVKAYTFENLNPNETRNIFFAFKTTPEMIKDTTATVKMRSVYVPDRNYKNHKKKTLEMEIVTSHDPNNMSSNATFINYRLVRFKKINFKTRFQNDGEGPARTIRLETDIPDMFDKKTLQIVDSYPKCPICPKNEEVNYSCLDTIIKKKQIHFTFKNIYIPGSHQKNVMEKDSTKGFVKYTMKLAKDFHKQTTRSRTSIFFDKNEPVITNYALTRFKPGTSIGAKAGYNFFPKLNDSKSYFTAITISPYKSYRWYWQVEWQNNLHQYATETKTADKFIIGTNGVRQLQRTINYSSLNTITTEVPVLVRYNINNYFGLGSGMLIGINLSQEETQHTKVELYENQTPDTLTSTTQTEQKLENGFATFKSGMFFEITGGFSRIGPSLGVRYVLNFEKNFNYIQVYGIWKF
jgi:PKD repeat protein